MSSNGTAGLFFLPTETTMNRIRYRKMLDDKVEIHLTIHECNMLMHDSSPCHRSKLASDFLQEKEYQKLDGPE